MGRKLAFDKTLFVVGVSLPLFGLVMIYSASAVIAMEQFGSPHHFLFRQGFALLIGLAAMGIAMHTDYRKLLERPSVYLVLLVSTALLVYVLFAEPHQGVHRWIRLGPIQIQPSEIAKLALVMYLAYQLARREKHVNDLGRTVLPCAVMVGQLALLVYLEPDLGTAGLYALLAIIMLFLAGLKWRFLVAGAVVGLCALGLMILQAPYRIQRILSYLNPDADPLGAGFQMRQSIIAIASGGVRGASLGESRQKLFFLPEPHTDFIFSVIAEELGFVGAVGIIVAFGVLLWRGVKAASGAPDRGGYYLALGITLVIVLQAGMNIAVALGMIPTKGVPLPFISYGGSSLVVCLTALGMLLNVSQHSS
ncbi:MAG: putative lipid II flippase FtsW [Acidobacteria bacterium]|nr:putative lipid II flippase FtsW [Acidobacteriota bacterium]